MNLPQIRAASPVSNPRQTSASAIEAGAAASAFADIAGAASDLRDRLQPELDRLAEERGARAADQAFEDREDENALPEVTRRRIWSRQDAVYNQALEAGVMARAQMDLEREAARLIQDHEYDPDGHETASVDFRNQYLGSGDGANFPAGMALRIEEMFDQRLTSDGLRIGLATRERQVREDQDSLERRLQQIRAAMSTGIVADPAFVNSDEFARLQGDAINVARILADNPAFGWSDERAAQALDEIANAGQEAVLYAEVDAQFAEGGELAARAFIEDQLANIELTNEARIGMRSRLQQRVNAAIGIENNRRAARNLAREEERLRNQEAGNDWEARALSIVLGGGRLTPEMIQEAPQHVASGALSPGQVNSLVNLPDQTDITEDPVTIVGQYDLARSGVSRDVVASTTRDLVTSGEMRISTREAILNEWEQHNSERMRSSLDTVQAFFSQNALFDFDSNLPILENSARRDLLDWSELNPDATRSQLEDQAVRLSIQRGRQVPPPPLPSLPPAPDPRTDGARAQEWREEAELAIESRMADGQLSEAEYNSLYRNLEHYMAWHRYQVMLNTTQVNNAGE